MRAIHCALAIGTALAAGPAFAVPYVWTDWTDSARNVLVANDFQATGTLTTGTASVDVAYYNANGALDLYQGATDYWANGTSGGGGRNDAISPYTSVANAGLGSPGVDNSPTGTDIVRLRFAGTQSLTFSEAIANPVFSFVSLNGNGYAFDQDFEILSCAACNIDGAGTDAGAYWGVSTTTQKTVVEVSPGVFEYRLISSNGEPHGTIRFIGSFSTVSWRSLSAENWNGFTLGIQGTAAEVFSDVPVPAAGVLMLGALGAFGLVRRRS